MYILLQANYEPHDFEKITVERGQFVTSYPNLSVATGLSVKQVRTAINHLLSTGELAVKKYPKYSVYTVVNYNEYQDNGQANGQAEGRQWAGNGQAMGTNGRKNKKDKKDNKSSILSAENENLDILTLEQYDELINLYDEKTVNKYVNKIIRWQDNNGKKINNPFDTIKKWIDEDNQKRQKSESKNKRDTSYNLDEFEKYALNFSLCSEEGDNYDSN